MVKVQKPECLSVNVLEIFVWNHFGGRDNSNTENPRKRMYHNYPKYQGPVVQS